jgi:microcystin-dependent protein
MATPFMSEIKIMSFNFPPKGWAFCNGQLLPINQNQSLFSLLGTTYGGDGMRTFALPNLQGRVPLHFGNGFSLGEIGGEAMHTLSIPEMPQHSHGANASSVSTPGSFNPAGNYLGGFNNVYAAAVDLTTIAPATIGNNGGSQSHENKQPYLVLSFCIALQGIFPSRG